MKQTAVTNRVEISAEQFPTSAGADEKILFLLKYAVLAPSNHNSQPWLFRLQGHELDVIAGKRDKLVGKIQVKHGLNQEEAERELDEWQKYVRL